MPQDADPQRARYQQIGRELLADSESWAGGVLRVKVISNSMAPLMQTGDFLQVEAVLPGQLALGEVVLIQREADYLTHRLIAQPGGRWRTKGDNNLRPDPISAADVIIGRVFCIERGRQSLSLQTRKWRLLNPLLASLGRLEWQAFQVQRHLRLPFRLSIRMIQRVFWPRS